MIYDTTLLSFVCVLFVFFFIFLFFVLWFLVSKETVSVRIRLPNGKQCLRKFTHKNNIGDIKNWVNHELVNNENAELINEFELVSTMPRTVYKNNTQTMKQLGFWRENAKRECRTPLLYVEEHAIVHGDESD